MGAPISLSSLRDWLKRSEDGLGFKVACREELASGGTAIIRRRIYSNGHREIEKTLHPRFQGHEDYEHLQLREHTILADLRHPGIVRALRLEMKPIGRKLRTGVLIFEDRQSVSLDALQSFVLDLPLIDRERFCGELLSALIESLDFIHSRGIVHGDLSPENILIDFHGFVQLIDFACSSREGVEPHRFLVRGKSFFRNPDEQAVDRVTSKSDCFALGRIVESLMGQDLDFSEGLSADVQTLLVDQTLPRRESPSSMRLSVLPGRELFFRQGRVVEKTLLTKAQQMVSQFPFQRLAACLLMGIFLTSWMPQWGRLTYNSWPKTLISIDAVNSKASFETPVTGMPIPAGRHRVRVKCPQNSCGSHEREIVVLPGDALKVFEDFHKN